MCRIRTGKDNGIGLRAVGTEPDEATIATSLVHELVVLAVGGWQFVLARGNPDGIPRLGIQSSRSQVGDGRNIHLLGDYRRRRNKCRSADNAHCPNERFFHKHLPFLFNL